MVGVEVKGVLVCDRNGLSLASNYLENLLNILIKFSILNKGKDVSISPGPVARLAELATTLTGRRTTVCLEHNDE